jgi:hypothetical protein
LTVILEEKKKIENTTHTTKVELKGEKIAAASPWATVASLQSIRHHRREIKQPYAKYGCLES